MLGGTQGIGKDTLLEPVKRAIGGWNFAEVSPTMMLGRFNGHLKTVLLRVSEARDLGDADRFSFYDHMKTILAAPPDTLQVDEKHIREHSIINCVGVVITTNHKSDGIFLPAEDRRHYVAWSDLKMEDFDTHYWNRLWGWYANGGYGHVAAYLRELDISEFDPKAPPPKTPAFWEIVNSNRSPEDAELQDVLDLMAMPDIAASAAPIQARAQKAQRRSRAKSPTRLDGRSPQYRRVCQLRSLWGGAITKAGAHHDPARCGPAHHDADRPVAVDRARQVPSPDPRDDVLGAPAEADALGDELRLRQAWAAADIEQTSYARACWRGCGSGPRWDRRLARAPLRPYGLAGRAPGILRSVPRPRREGG